MLGFLHTTSYRFVDRCGSWDCLRSRWLTTEIQHQNVERIVTAAIKMSGLALIVVFPFVSRQCYAYKLFCNSSIPRPWCDSWLPSIYSYAQEHYWYANPTKSCALEFNCHYRNVGLFRYWTLLQLPLFLLSAPVLLLSFGASYQYYTSRSHLLVTHQIVAAAQTSSNFLKNPRLLPYIHLFTALTCILFFASHVQICLRLIATNPVPYWFAAHLFVSNSKYSKYWIRYCLIWSPISVVLWVGFYPPA